MVSEIFPVIYLARHGETAWSVTGQHTGLTDLPLSERGERNAVRLGERLAGSVFAKVMTSPLQRATRTCELAGFGGAAEIDRDLVEWNYGDYEGLRTAEIHAKRPDWELFRDGCPNGESPEQIGSRADLVINRVRAINGNVLIFSRAHFLQIAHRLLFRGHLDLWQARPGKIFHPGRVRGDGIDRLDPRPNFRCVPPVMKLDPHARMICHPFAGESLCRRVAAMAIDDQ